MVKDGMKLKNIIVEKVERKQSNGPRPAVVIARLQSKQNKVEIMEMEKKNLEKYKSSTRTNDPEQFYSDLTRQVYMYQNLGKLYIVGDFNSRCSDTSDFIEGVDELPSRETIDQGSNANGDLLIDFLVDCNICMINGRKGKQDFTCISKRGKSVVDYIFTTHENLNSCIDFNVKTMSDITDSLDLQECSQIPDHSVLQAVIKREASVPHNTVLKFPTNLKRIPNKPKSYQIPNDFLNDDNAREKIEQTINKIENALADRRDVDEAYRRYAREVISKIGHKSAHDHQHKITSRKSKYKPYWNENLQEHWENACEQEKVWLKCKICGPKKKRLREHFVTARNDFDKLLRKEKRNYQLRQQKELFDLSKESNTRDFWRKIGKLGIAKDRHDKIPMEVRLPNGNISKDINIVYETWKNEYEHLFNTSDGEYDEGFLTFIQQQVDHDLVNNIENNSDTLNSDISYEDVEKSVYRAKLNKSTGSGSSPRSNFDFSCGNTVVKYDSKYRYLGMWIDEHLDWKFTVREVRKSASRALSALYTKFIACGGMDFDIYEKLYENLVQPVLLYGSSIWGISEHKQLETVQNRACRYFLGAFKNSTNLAVRGDMGWTTVKTKQNIEVMRLFFKLSNLEDDRIVRTIHETSKAKQRSWHSRVY
ncbi:unnamed protein product [Mytilus edulis]|uniref:Endonuclease/exonuclease/phosphatase domain-containing protein n=1 Tax=Mytilus edulis TaxID=6550 RepID=A0A8S3SJU5_MYTED|nr:unnamed protein product [Mytilus edulis]